MDASDTGQPSPATGNAPGRFAIELNDAAITVCHQDGVILQSPGLALVLDGKLLLGNEALRQARHHPRQVQSRFWGQLGMDPLPRPTTLARTQADLVFAHLKAIRHHLPEGTHELLLAVPGTLERDQLGLLLGMTQALDLPVTGVVDTAVAATTQPFPDGTLAHLSLHLHQSVITFLDQGEGVRRARVAALPGLGLLDLEDTLARGIADHFVDRTRFDPLKLPATEQALYNGLPGWLTRLARDGIVEIEMEAGGRTHRLSLSTEDVVQTLSVPLNQLALWIQGLTPPATPLAIQACSQFTLIPGLEQSLRGHIEQCRIVPLAPGAPGLGTLYHAEAIRTPAADRHLVTTLPWAGQAAEDAVAPATPADPRPAPTHVVYQGLAHALSERPLAVGREPPADGPHLQVTGALAGVSRLHCELSVGDGRVWVEDRSTYGILLNGRRIDTRAELHAGDLLDLGGPGQHLQLITVTGPDAPP